MKRRLAHGVLYLLDWVRHDRTDNRRSLMMRMLLGLAVLGMVAAPAMARPDLPPHAFRADVSNRMSMAQDGRAGTAMEHVDRPSFVRPSMVQETREAHQRAWNDLADHHAKFSPPLKTEISMKMHKGDNITGSQPQSAMARSTQVQAPKDRMGRAATHFAPPLKAEISMKMHKGDNLLGSASSGSAAKAGSTAYSGAMAKSAGAQQNRVLSKKEKTDLCRQSGVCIPFLQGSDDPSDKTE
ncbi:MAG: hypothetical protein ACHQ17_15970 [Polyangia bacterium]|jgi:hypothetical protein